jgi:hypothetical protein
MQSKWRKTQLGRIVLIGLVGASALGASVLVASATGVVGPLITEQADGNRREIETAAETAAEIEQPTISFIDSPSATCYQPDTSRNTCYVEWNYLYVTAGASQYIISMTVSLDNRLVAYHSGFFQTSMYIPSDLVGRGFKVACGPRGANGLGNSYAYTLRARETGGLSAANYGSVTCPGVYLVYVPLIRR